jgi:hypothetical protein
VKVAEILSPEVFIKAYSNIIPTLGLARLLLIQVVNMLGLRLQMGLPKFM